MEIQMLNNGKAKGRKKIRILKKEKKKLEKFKGLFRLLLLLFLLLWQNSDMTAAAKALAALKS